MCGTYALRRARPQVARYWRRVLASGVRFEPCGGRGYDLAHAFGVEPATFAIAFCVNQPVVASTILGATRLDQLESCLAGATLTWTEAMQTAVDDLQCVSKTMPRFPEDWARLVG